jgi:hypothetical protein
VKLISQAELWWSVELVDSCTSITWYPHRRLGNRLWELVGLVYHQWGNGFSIRLRYGQHEFIGTCFHVSAWLNDIVGADAFNAANIRYIASLVAAT